MKNFLITSLTAIALLSFNACSNNGLDRDLSTTDGLTEANIVNVDQMEQDNSSEWEAKAKYKQLLKSFGKTRTAKGREVPDFPDYYGGAYITKKGTLAIYIYGDFEGAKKRVVSMVGEGDVEYKKADFSFSYLRQLMDELNEFVLNEKNPSISSNFNVFGLRDAENCIVVELKEFNDNKIQEFQNSVVNSPAIKFVQSEGEIVLNVDLYPGCEVRAGTSVGSFGFRARRNSDSQVGMVTAGHVIPVGEGARAGDIPTIIGTCSASQVSGSIDAAFIPITFPNNYVPTNILCGSSNVLSTSTDELLGSATVYKIGQATGLTFGQVISSSTSVTVQGGITLTNIVSTSYAAAVGDSGGIVYSIDAGNIRPTVGLHFANTTSGSTSYYAKADEVLSAFGLSRY
ncbi:hypothetical protein FXV77_05370 [Sphingobacterium phlebotomi]|uniref:Serine protease n=1 Tax=Sphingobacterium phlebotomi TaxID=2605433 RepID=A0A5D4HD21_9SPHI|nr:hypothetical protein [Sphingobacterium phlebotomi]TYR37435.1 hypothetical protein FXV77_05370 [Sphingobacterium phlebotomi]